MSMDGSFRLNAELERLIARCPKLGSVAYFSCLLNKGHELEEVQVVNALAAMFLHPSYTIPIAGCFRPIAKKIIDRVVELLKLIPNLRFNYPGGVVNSMEERFFVDCEDMDDVYLYGVIETYSRCGRFLDLHELANFAFCRALDLAPFLRGSVECYYEFGGPPFSRIIEMAYIIKAKDEASVRHLRDLIWTSYRLLLLDPEYFSSRWNWCCFLDLVHQSESFDVCIDTKLIRDIRWCGVQILCVLLRLPSRTAVIGMQPSDVLPCLLRWYEFCWDVSIEKAGWIISRKETLDGDAGFSGGEAVSINTGKLLEYEPERFRRQQRYSSPFLLTSSIKSSFERAVLAVSQKWPVLLYGPPGSGKTALISKLAQEVGNQVLSIHMDEQIDGRTLVGSYVCTEQPGEFRWQPGPLTQAVINGFWVVFENIDQAASDVQSILLPLLEGGSTFLTGYGEGIRVAEGFRLFSTISTSKADICYHTEGRNSLSALWRRVMVRPAACVDLANIVTAWYPDLEPITGTITETFEKLNGVSEFPGYGSKNSSSRFTLRDLLKWCRRIAGLDLSFRADGLSVDLRSRIYLEAVDVFAVNAASPGNRLNIARNIANMWAVPAQEAEALYCLSRPVLEDLPGVVHIGRVSLQKNEEAVCFEKKPFVEIRSSFHVLERIACAVKWNEAVLLVGETGTGKTTLVQNLAARLGQKLTVLNLSQQSDVADLLGGFKPMDPQYICVPLYMEFESLFSSTFSLKDNENFLVRLKKLVNDKNWSTLISGFQKGVRKVVEIGRCGPGTKRKRPLDERVLGNWEKFSHKVEIAHKQLAASSGMVFSFVEGAFVTALRNGEWILLDEVNLAPPETLQRIIGVLDGENGSLCLAENGVVVDRHPHFRLFACMNPATDAGKRDLPYSLRSRFTEYFVDDVLEDEDLTLFVNQFLDDKHTDKDLVNKIVRFYKAAKKESEEKLLDGANQKPQYSLRSLYRALEYIRKARKLGFRRAVYDGFCMFFMTLLEDHSAELMNEMIVLYLLGGHKQLPPPIHLEQLLHIRERPESEQFLREYIITKSVEEHIRSLARAVYIKRYPVLLQGPTSSGKTSLVQYLAAKTGHEFVRINNHEHTDLQEYLGSYITDACGRLAFHEGVLVKAVRYGHWIVLDELNLAPSDVLEALNRLLDDNRELFVPELRETVRAHPNFMLFATQNPPTFYGGRKMLSRAFRNRFVEIHVDDIPEDELTDILENKCKVPRSYAKKMIEVMKELQLRRQKSKVFAGKHGFITPRDLFRWANRFRKFGTSYEDLARDGYFLLAERLRDEIEKNIVQEVLEKHLRVKLKTDELYKQGYEANFFQDNVGNIVWTKSMQRMYFLIERCYQLKEPVLLIGETGGGKTTVCQLLSMALNSKLHILNCHQYTETSDFIGGFYPVRERSRYASDFKILIEQLVLSKAFIHFHNDINLSTDIGKAPSTLKQLEEIVNRCKHGLVGPSEVNESDLASLVKMKAELSQLYQQWQTIFVWQDGPLVHAMKNGDLFLVDEISLADDSVLERLNSVLEPDRKLSLAEKGGPNLETVTAHDDFFILATMNPGGDYGKKELSPALRNRFTEIWVPPIVDLDELRGIAKRFLSPELHCFVNPLSNFWEWFNELQAGRTLTVRDLLAWLDFVTKSLQSLHPNFAFLHGAFLVLLDGLSLGTGISKNEVAKVRERCLAFLVKLLKADDIDVADTELLRMENYGWADADSVVDTSEPEGMQCDNLFGIHPFYIEKGGALLEDSGFEFLAPTTRRNVLRVLRAMQLSKPVLLEGSPGVGKTSLISAIGKFSGHKVVRINLSEQTDIMDLLGSDLPIESDEGLQFAWSDGILLQALKEGSWVLLDEINLAQQSVLEGLNAILDHRAEVFIPELGQSFQCPSSFRVFACQNPSYQGGGRKCLPKSFLNRFMKVYVDELGEHDYHFICRSRFPSVPDSILTRLIEFNKRLYEETMVFSKFAQHGSPWEFNLRDIIRSCQIIEGSSGNTKTSCFLNAVYVQRMRTAADRREVLRLYEEVFGMIPSINPYPRVQMDDHFLVVGDTRIKRNCFQTVKSIGSELKIFPGLRNTLEAAAQCIQRKWLCILVGPTSSGKTSLIRLLAQLSGNVLHEINLSSASDISELLGSFEQYNAYRNFHSIATQIERYINEYCNLQLDLSADDFLRERKVLITKWLYFSSNISFGNMSKSDAADGHTWRESLSVLVEIIELLAMDLKRYTLSVSWSLDDLSIVLQRVQKLQEIQKGKSVPVKFEWAAGLLIKAIENGEWIVLEDANLCNPTVLDRINSLVESEGSITVNECGNVDGKPLVLSPHPNFRMFLTLNPSHGDVSRAMRNRGIEIFMMHPYWLHNEDEKKKIELDDIKSFLALYNIPHGMLVDSMAKAHMHARNEGLRLDVHISYLELGRWVHLFEQLLMTGNDALWSLHRSWEHSYLSSFGEPEGWQIVQEAKAAYLTRIGSLYHGGKLVVVSEDACSKQVTDVSNGDFSLCLPCGWPAPLKLRDFVWYSIEASVRQNCMYLEYLGVQCASHELCVPRQQQLLRESVYMNNSQSIYLMDLKMLLQMMYPQSSNEKIINYSPTKEHDMLLIKKKLLFAADWVIDQVFGKSDLELCLLWFSWFDLQLHPWCHFFQSFGNLLRKELVHPIWKCIFKIHDELSHPNVEGNLQSLPILSLESADVIASLSMSSSKQLSNAINSVGLLRRSLWQWNAETNEEFTDKSVENLLHTLRKLEEEVLDAIVESPSYDLLHQTYADLLEEHTLFWKVVVSSEFETLLVHWRALLKTVFKLREHFPEAVKNLLISFDMASINLNRRLPFSLKSEKSLLWAHGGHPSLPFSADINNELQQLLGFAKVVWPRKHLQKEVDGCIVEIAASTNTKLRSLAMQGVCMTSSLFMKYEEGNVAENLQEMHKMLSMRFESERNKLEAKSRSQTSGYTLGNSACCTVIPEILNYRFGLETWVESLPIIDETSLLLDLFLLQDLSSIILADTRDLQLPLQGLYRGLQNSLDFSINFSSRTPLDFVPHQEMLWIIDAWTTAPEVGCKLVSSVLELWFKWHSSLWNCPIISNKELPGTNIYKFMLPDMLVKPVKTDTVQQILHNAYVMKDYQFRCFKLRVVSSNIWRSIVPNVNLHSSLQHSACYMLLQIISAHRKSFTAENFMAIKSCLLSLQRNEFKQDDMEALLSLLGSSRHQKFVSLVEPFIKPLLKTVADICSFEDSQYHISCAWLRLGGLRFHLLLACDELDPAIKYSSKHQKLVDKCKSLKLEIQVRHDCNYLVGSFSTRKSDEQRASLLENYESKCEKLQRKVICRSDPGKFIKLKDECIALSEHVNSGLKLLEESNHITSLSSLIYKTRSWQATASHFIDRLSEEYDSYVDIIQPIQVAVYEMKLGMALLLSSALQRDYLGRVQETKVDPILDAIYSFMRFPLEHPFEKQVQINFSAPEFPFYTVSFSTCIWVKKMDLLRKVIKSTDQVDEGKKATTFQLEASLLDNILGHVVKLVSNTKLLDDASFTIVDEIFHFFTRLWRDVKVQEKTEKDIEAQMYKFRPRPFKLDNAYEIDLSSLSSSFSGDSFTEWKESLNDEESAQGKDVIDQPESSGDWNLIPEPMLNSMVNMHNQLFGSNNLVETLGIVQLSNSDKLNMFAKSYSLGATLLKDLMGISASFLDTKLVGEHILRLCMEHERILPVLNKSDVSRNFYKDPNPAVVASMVELLNALREQVSSLLKERDEHAGLQKILNISDMLLGLPSSTTVAQALSGLQFLVSQVRLLQENGAKFPLTDQLEPIVALISCFQKMEFDMWKTMLDDVLAQFEMNAAKLWFPLYLVLHRESTTDIVEYTESTLQSLEEFVRTSSVGEFRRRLQLILSFYGQLNAGIDLKSYSSCTQKENRDILYNVFGFYMQSLPTVMNHIASSTKNIRKELEELLKLCHWDRPEKLMYVENSKRNRQKLKKLIQKYTDALQQPVMLVLSKEPGQIGLKSQKLDYSPVKDQESFAFDISQFADRSSWYEDWKRKIDNAVQDLHGGRKVDSRASLLFSEVDASTIRQQSILKSPDLAYKENWSEVWHNLEKICRVVAECADMWKDEGKSQVKMRAFSDLLKLLENHGLSKHKSNLQKLLENNSLFTTKSALIDEKFKQGQSNWWFYLPSYDAKHLLLKHDSLPQLEIDANVSGFFKSSNSTNVEERWRCANQYYFKSLASVRHLQQISLNFHKDFNPDQVNRCNSFLEHLVMIQMEQRAAAYDMFEKLQHLRRSLGCFKKLNLDCHPYTEGNTDEVDVSNSQCFMFKIMWQQKELFDTFCSVLDEESLMLQIVGSTHLDGCDNIKNAANEIFLLIEKFSSLFIKSKARLDDELLDGGDSAIKLTASMHPVVVSKDMDLLVIQNFQLIRELKEHVLALRGLGIDKRSVKDILLGHLEELIIKAEHVESEFNSSKSCNKPLVCAENVGDQEAEIGAKLDSIYRYIGNSFQELDSCCNRDIFDEAFLGKISSWKLLFDSFAADLQLHLISQELDLLISYAGKLPDCGRSSNTGLQFKHLEELLALILAFSDGLLLDFLAVHEMVSILTHRLAEIFASLFSEGYGVRTEDQADDTQGDKTQDASGTGMGEGAGVKDVSNQITDEDQLLGTSGEKEEPNTMNELPSKNDEGIEMQENFEASEYSVSEDTGNEDNYDENEDDEVEQIDRAMGNTGDDGEVADEKLWDKEEDQNLDSKTEKYDSGPSVKDKDPNNRELKAKDDSAATTDEQTEGNSDVSGENEDMDTGKDNIEDNDNDSMNLDQEDTRVDPPDIDINEPDQPSAEDSENMEVDPDNVMEEDESDKMDNDMDKADSEDNTAITEDETSLKSESNHLGEEAENDDSENKNERDDNMDLTTPTMDNSEQGNSNLLTDHIPNTQSMSQTMTEMQKADSRSTAPQSSSGFQNDLASSENPSQVEMLLGNSSKGNISNDQPESNSPQHDLSSLQKNQPNPLRNIGDALQEWKEQVKVSADIPQGDEETVNNMDDEAEYQFGFTSELDQGTDQAKGSAMPDQVEHNIGHDKPDVDGLAAQENELKELHDEDSNSETVPSHPVSTRRVDEKINNFNSLNESPVEDTQEYKRKDNISPERPAENFVSVKKSYTTEDMNQLSEILANGDEPGKVQNLAQQLNEMQMNASALWRKYELRTMRLSQELAEQLRLVMEPTLASKLQGDYRTGKRINMKKVIPYIASHYRKDKIWLRRTKPNKRDYQVVIVVDDSRSMSENCCGDFAIEALVTVCRALSQLEVGKLAVTSFGKEGNIKLLHDFDQPLTGEAGMKMISSLTFNQENTLREEPMVELLKYLNNMLEHAVANARLPSGQNPLQQLVLIIADGRFHDNKEKVKRLMRDVLQRNCMVAFIVLDSAQESIVDCKDYIFKNGLLQKAVPYLDSFPFPYYMVLRNIEALPRTLADLLRQWLELMQQSRD